MMYIIYRSCYDKFLIIYIFRPDLKKPKMTPRIAFSNRKQPVFHLSFFRQATGVLLGLFYAFCFYSVLYLLRETFRILSLTEDYNLWVLAAEEVDFYNLFFAFLAVILGQSVCFIFWFDRPKKIFERVNFRKSAIVNDQRALNWYFLSWFSKMAFVFGITYGFVFRGEFLSFSLYPDYNFLFVLIIIFLFFQSWNTLRITFVRKSYRWMLASFVIVSVLSFGLSRINLVDYKTINGRLLSKNIQYQYKLDLPVSEVFEKSHKNNLMHNIYVVCDKTDTTNLHPFIVIDNQKVPIDSLALKIRSIQELYDKIEIPYINFRLCIHQYIRMDFVEEIKKVLLQTGISTVTYAVTPAGFKTKFKIDKVSFPVPLTDSEITDPKIIGNKFKSVTNLLSIDECADSTLYVNSLLIDGS